MRYSLCLEVLLPTLQAPAAYFDIVRRQDICDVSERSIRTLQHRRVVNYEINAEVIYVKVEMGSVGYLQDALPFGVRRSWPVNVLFRYRGVLYEGRRTQDRKKGSSIRREVRGTLFLAASSDQDFQEAPFN
jgi:hypothetical protein